MKQALREIALALIWLIWLFGWFVIILVLLRRSGWGTALLAMGLYVADTLMILRGR